MNCTVGLAKLLFTEREEHFKLFRVDFKTPRGIQRVEQIEVISSRDDGVSGGLMWLQTCLDLVCIPFTSRMVDNLKKGQNSTNFNIHPDC
jgi:hypothetical protein